MSIMQVTKEIINLLRDIIHILEVTSSLGGPKNRRWCHALAWRMSIKLCLRSRDILRLWYFSKILTSHLLLQCPCIMIIQLLSSSLVICTFLESMKHIELDYYYIWEKVISEVISTPYVGSSHQLVDVFAKRLVKISYDAMYQAMHVWFTCSNLRGDSMYI